MLAPNGRNRASEIPLLCNTWDEGKVLLQSHLKLIPGSCNYKGKGFHWILAVTDVHRRAADELEAHTALQHPTCGDLANTFACRNLPESSQCPAAAGEPRIPILSAVSMQFLGSDLHKVDCFKKLSRGRQERSLLFRPTSRAFYATLLGKNWGGSSRLF